MVHMVLFPTLLLATICSATSLDQHHHRDGIHKRSAPAVAPSFIPVDTPEVAAAKAAHFAAHAAIKITRTTSTLRPVVPAVQWNLRQTTPQQPWRHQSPTKSIPVAAQTPSHGSSWNGVHHVPVIENGVPVEPPEVQQARAAHAAAHAKVQSLAPVRLNLEPPFHTSKPSFPKASSIRPPTHYVTSRAPSHSTRTTSKSYPTPKKTFPQKSSTPKVQPVKAVQFAIISDQAPIRVNPKPPSAFGSVRTTKPRTQAPVLQYSKITTPQPYGSWNGAQHVPVIKNGVPEETPEVQQAKEAHLKALAAAGGNVGTFGAVDGGHFKVQLGGRGAH